MIVQDLNPDSQNGTVVFLHGFLLDSSLWKNLKLEKCSWRSICLDLPFHGKALSENLGEKQISTYAHYVEACLTAHGVHEYSLVGHSMGGYIGLQLLKLNPALEKLILLHSNIWSDSPEQRKNRNRVREVIDRNKKMFLNEALPLLFFEPEKHKSFLENSITNALDMDNDGIEHSAISMRDRNDSFDIIQHQKEKCYFIQGQFDNLVPNKEARRIWEKYALKDQFYEIESVGHMSPIENPYFLKDIIKKIIGAS